MIHELKTWPEYFEKVLNGDKTFELRKNDRNYRKGDTLILKEWNPNEKQYTGRRVIVFVSNVLKDAIELGLMDGYCIMSISKHR